MSKNRVWIAGVAGLILSFGNLLYAQNVTTSTTNPDAMLDVLKTLETKGVLTHQEYEALKLKVTNDEQKAAEQQQTAVQQAVQQAAPQLKTVAMQDEQAKADNTVTMMSSGVGFHAGRFDVSITGEVNGFYVQDRADTNSSHLTCLLCEASAGNRPSGAIRSGLLPGDLSFKISTQEHGWDVAVFFGIWPAIQNNAGSPGTVEGGVPGQAALGTPGIDFRQQFATLGRAHVGTLKIGRDLGLFGQEAILNDMTLLGAGSPGLSANGNVNPGNVTLGRIGVGYVYTDFLPQITYSTPTRYGLSAAIGVFAPYNDPLSPAANLTGHGQPMIQGKLGFSAGRHGVKAKFWSNFMTQAEQAGLGGASIGGFGSSTGPCPTQTVPGQTEICTFPGSAGTVVLSQGNSVRAWGVDYGTALAFHGLGLVAYGYNGSGLGQAGLLWDGTGLSSTGGLTTRESSGYYVQPSFTFHKAFVGYSYGQSILTAASAADASLLAGSYALGFRANSSHIAQFRYAVTSWDNLVAEWTHTRSEVQGGTSATNITTSDSLAFGTIVFF